jgi:hypothetical protein
MMGSSMAAGAMTSAANTAATEQLEVFDKQFNAEAPWRAAGGQALGQLQGKIAAGPGQYTQSPGYLYNMGQGTQASNQAAASQGLLLSGQQQRALNQYGQQYASGDYQNFLNRYYQSLTPYQSLAGLGQTAVGATTGLAGQTGQGLANTALTAGQAQASSYLTQSALGGNMLNNAGLYLALANQGNNQNTPVSNQSEGENLAFGSV